MADRKVTIKRQFAVILEDAITATVPDGVPDDEIEEWARDNYDDLFLAAQDNELQIELGNGPATDTRLLWEDQHKSSVDSIDDEYIIETEG